MAQQEGQAFTEGMKVFRPHQNAPSFIKGNVVIDVAEFCNWLHNHKRSDGTVKLTLKESGSTGNLYTVLDTFVTEQERANNGGF